LTWGDFPDNRPVKTEICVYGMIAESADFPPRHFRQPIPCLWAEARCRLADDHELPQYGITENVVIVPLVAVLLKPTVDSSCRFGDVSEVERIPTRVTRHTRPRHHQVPGL
jgi:hypothetical protein